MGLVVEVDASALTRAHFAFLQGLEEHIWLALSISAERVAERARIEHAYEDRSGALTRSITAHDATGQLFAKTLASEVSADAGHGAFIELGTRAHRITARRAKMLRFVLNGRVVFRHSVWHPGNDARKFLADAIDHELPAIVDHVLEGTLDAFAEAGFGIDR